MNTMKPLKTSLLLNAEPFGFGPSAAIATFFPYLRERFDMIGYVGKGHTLDLQRRLPYDAVHDLSDYPEGSQKQALEAVLSDYGLFLTAMDFSFADIAIKKEVPTVVYDALTWYWEEMPSTIRHCDLYLAQDFFGVRERIQVAKERFPLTCVVPPITNIPPVAKQKNHVLINLGGLRNPFMSEQSLLKYASSIIAGISEAIPSDEKVLIATSKGLAQSLGCPNARAYNFHEMYELLSESKYAFMTPGLGNINDAARCGVPTIWLPPANDSQGQQLKLLTKNLMVDGAIDWHTFLGKEIDYSKPQKEVLQAISQAIETAVASEKAKKGLTRLAKLEIEALGKNTQLEQLVERFGNGGAEAVANELYGFACRKIESLRSEGSQ